MGGSTIPTKRRTRQFQLNSADRKMLDIGLNDITLWSQYYFNGWTPLPYQHQFYHAPQKDKLLIAGIRTGKALPTRLFILTPKGWNKFGDLAIGDQVFGSNGYPTNVTGVYPQPDQKSYEMVFSDGSVVPCSSDHLWLTHDFHYRKAIQRRVDTPDPNWISKREQCRPKCFPQVLTTQEIKDTLYYRTQMNHAIPLAKPIQFPEKELPIDPYLLGIWESEGTARNCTIATADQEVVDSFINAGFIVTQKAKYTYHIGSIGDSYKYNKFTRLLRSLGVLGNKHIPEIYLRSSVKQRLALFQGMMDGDGTVCKKSGMCTFNNSNKTLIDNVKELIVSLGIQYRETSKIPKIKDKEYNRSYGLNFTPTIPVFRLSRQLQYQKLDKIPPDRNYRYIVDVKEIPSEPMRCISVDSSDGLYLIGRNLIPTHNTKGIANGFLHYAWSHPNSRLANACISADQANIVYNDVIDFVSRPRFEHWVEDDQKHPYPKIRLVNGSELWFRSIGYEAELWRGWEFDWINVDEAAYVAREAAIKTLRGRLLGSYQIGNVTIPRAGIFTMTSSPKGKTWLFDRWKKGDPECYGSQPEKYLSLRARTKDNIYLPADQIEDLMSEYTDRMVQQELEGLFLDSEGAVFPYEQVINACSESDRLEVMALQVRLQRWLSERNLSFKGGELDYYSLEPERNHIYLNSWDLGKRPTKKGRNAMVGGVFDVTKKPYELVAYRYAPGAAFGMAHEWIKDWAEKYDTFQGSCETITDATGKGDPVTERLEEEAHIPISGIIYTGMSKPQIVISGQIALEKGWLVFPFIRRMVDQLQSYELDDKQLPQDIVMMMCQAMHRARQKFGEQGKTIERSITNTRKSSNDPSMDRYRARRQSGRRR